MVLTAYVVLSPVTGLSCHRRLRISFCHCPVGPIKHPQNLTPASGRQDHTILPSAKSVSRQRAGDRSRIQRTRPATPSRAKRCRVHRIPSRVRDDHDTPLLWGGTRKVLEVIWGVRKPKYFCKQGWTALSTNRPTGKSPDGSERKFARVPDAVQRPSRCTAEPGPIGEPAARWTPDQQPTTPQSHSASKTRANALMALRSIPGTNWRGRSTIQHVVRRMG
jgi:hypothetical protein